MLKNLFSCLILTCLMNNNSYSQKLMHSYGTTISVLYGKINTPEMSSNFTMVQTTLTYFPRYNFVEKENSSFSIGFPVGIGVGITSNTIGDDAGISFAYDLPATLDYNIGFKSTNENDKKFGGYFGVGFGYFKVSVSGSQYSDFKGAAYGPLFRSGIRFFLPKDNTALTVGMYYKKGLEKSRLNTIGFNVLYDL